MRIISRTFSVLAVFSAMICSQSVVAIPMYEALPASNSSDISRHGGFGPVLADDFTPISGGRVTSVEWWGLGLDQSGNSTGNISGNSQGDEYEL